MGRWRARFVVVDIVCVLFFTEVKVAIRGRRRVRRLILRIHDELVVAAAGAALKNSAVAMRRSGTFVVPPEVGREAERVGCVVQQIRRRTVAG